MNSKEESDEIIEAVERIADVMGKHKLTEFEYNGLKLKRSESAPYYEALGQRAAEVAAKPQPTDEELLLDPMAGLTPEKEVTHG